MVKKFQFKGKDVDDAVNKACGRFGVGRDELDISIVSTGSTGIFGLLKKQAAIEACLKNVPAEQSAVADEAPETVIKEEVVDSPPPSEPAPEPEEKVEDKVEVAPSAVASAGVDEGKKGKDEPVKKSRPRYRPPQHDPEPVPDEFHAGLEGELLKLLELMGMECSLSFSVENGKTKVDIHAETLIAPLTARDGQALDGLQYLLRKMTSQTLPENGMFVVDIDGFRAKRRLELQELALSLSVEVKEKSVTRTIPPLNPSERRIVHMHLQDDTSIRSRSVGSGLFKKILIYKPGTRKRPSRKRSNRSRGGKGGRRDTNGNK